MSITVKFLFLFFKSYTRTCVSYFCYDLWSTSTDFYFMWRSNGSALLSLKYLNILNCIHNALSVMFYFLIHPMDFYCIWFGQLVQYEWVQGCSLEIFWKWATIYYFLNPQTLLPSPLFRFISFFLRKKICNE